MFKHFIISVNTTSWHHEYTCCHCLNTIGHDKLKNNNSDKSFYFYNEDLSINTDNNESNNKFINELKNTANNNNNDKKINNKNKN